MTDHPMPADFYGLIIAGGAGTRLWPISRQSVPKQLLNLAGSDRSLLQNTFARLSRSVASERIKTVTSTAYDRQVLHQLREIASAYPEHNVMAEPIGRDSAAAVLWGTLRLYHENRDAVMAVVWSDQMIRNEHLFDEALARAYTQARQGGLVAVGVQPNRPATTLGYIRYGAQVAEGLYQVERFVEKPDRAAAERLLAEGQCAWNAGIFVFNVRTLLDEFERLAPRMMAYFREHDETLEHNDWSDPDLMQSIYGRMRKESIDYLVLEKTDRLLVTPADLDWSDLGSWDELYFQSEKDADGNARMGETITVDTRNCYIQGGKRLIATVGVQDLVVVDTEDAVLVCNMRSVQDIKTLVELLRQHRPALAEGFEQTDRPWGSYTVLHEGPGCKVKVLEVKPHQRMSLQMHRHRAEHWVVVEGTATLTCDGSVREFAPNEYLHIPQGAKHRIENQGESLLRIIEVQHGSYLGEDDIVRFEDSYGRS